MKTVKFKAPFFIEGTRYDKGLQAVQDQHLDRLPSSAEILDDETAREAAARIEEARRKAREPKSLKEMRSGRNNARPLGKEAPKPALKKAADKPAE